MPQIPEVLVSSARRVLGEDRYQAARTKILSMAEKISSGLPDEHGTSPWSTDGEPVISVVVPIHNTENYLTECLESIRQQSYPWLEVIMLDDESTDGSGPIAQEFARLDPRFRYYRQAHGDVSVARNAGIKQATGSYLGFVDADDVLAPDAYQNLLGALQHSGSDFAISGWERWHGNNRWRFDWVTRLHAADRFGVTIDEVPEAVKDVFVWNKLYRTDFFRQAIGGYSIGVRYEDHEPAAKGFTACAKFDLLAVTTYYWRIRDDGTSITQGQTRAVDLADRITAMHATQRHYRHHASERVYRYWLQDTAGLGLGSYYWTITGASDEYWAALRDLTSFFFATLDEQDWSRVSLRERVMAGVIAADDRARAEQLSELLVNHPRGIPLLGDTAGYRIDTTRLGIDDFDLPEFIIGLSGADLNLQTGFTTLGWLPEGDLEINGFCYLDHLDMDINSSTVRCWIQYADGDQLELDLERFSFAQDSPWLPKDSFLEYANAGIRLIVPLSAIQTPCSVHLELELDGIRRQDVWRPQNQENITMIRPFTTDDGRVYVLTADPSVGLQITAHTHDLVVSELSIGTNGLVTFDVNALTKHRNVRIRALNQAAGLVAMKRLDDIPAGGTKTARISLPRITADSLETQWTLSVIVGGHETPIPFPRGTPEQLASAEAGYLGLRTSSAADLRLAVAPWSAVITEISGGEAGLRIHGRYQAAPGAAIPNLTAARLDGVQFDSSSFHVDDRLGSFDATVNLLSGTESPLPTDDHIQRTFALCLTTKANADGWSWSRPIHFDDRSRNGHRLVVNVGTEQFEVTDFGPFRSAQIRKL